VPEQGGACVFEDGVEPAGGGVGIERENGGAALHGGEGRDHPVETGGAGQREDGVGSEAAGGELSASGGDSLGELAEGEGVAAGDEGGRG